jgi:TonB family protein
VPERPILIAALAAAVAVAGSAQASEPEKLTRTGKWVVDYDRDACHLLAQFGTGEHVLAIRLTRYEPGDSFDLVFYGHRVASPDTRSEAKIDFGLRGTPAAVKTVNGKAGNLPMMLIGSARLDGWEREKSEDIAPSLSPQQEDAVTGVTVRIGRKKAFRVEFGPLSKPMAQLRTCQADLLKSWGYDPVVQTTLATPVKPANSPASWLRDNDYPSGAVAAGQNGVVQFRLDVDAEGKVHGCHVLARTSPDVFADTTCRNVTRRARLKPALDLDGKPVRSFFVQKVYWQMTE